MRTMKFLVFLIILSLSIFVFATGGITYSQISNVQTQLIESLLGKQLPNGAFVLGKFPQASRWQFYSTLSSLLMLKQCGFPMNSSAFQKGINFLLNNYNPFSASTLSSYIPLDSIEALEGGKKVKLSQYAQLVKNTVCSSYLNDILLFSNSNQIKSSTNLKQVFFLIQTIFSIIKNSTKNELTNWMSPNAINKNEAFVSNMVNLYEAISKVITKSFDGKNGAFVLMYMTELDKYILNSYGEKIRDEMFSYGINDILKSPLERKIRKKLAFLQMKNGSWGWKLALGSVGISSTSTTSMMSTSVKESLAVQTTALNLESLLESGVPATSQSISKGILYLVTTLPKLLHEKMALEEISQPFMTLEIYSQKMFGKKYNFGSLPAQYVKTVNVNDVIFSKLLSNLYVGETRSYISNAIFNNFFGKSGM